MSRVRQLSARKKKPSDRAGFVSMTRQINPDDSAPALRTEESGLRLWGTFPHSFRFWMWLALTIVNGLSAASAGRRRIHRLPLLCKICGTGLGLPSSIVPHTETKRGDGSHSVRRVGLGLIQSTAEAPKPTWLFALRSPFWYNNFRRYIGKGAKGVYVRIMKLQKKKTETYEEAGHGGHQNELNGIGLLPSREASLGRKSAKKGFKYNQAVKRSGGMVGDV